MAAYEIQPGDHLSQVAQAAGFRSADTVWDAPENADLRALRDNPSVLAAGDSLFVPDKTTKTLSRAIDARHPFVAKIDKLLLRLIVYDFDNKPMPGLATVLTVAGRRFDLTTDGDGAVQAKIPMSAQTGHFSVPDLEMEHELKIGELDPPDTEAGWRARLINLGYFGGALRDAREGDDAKFWGWALEEFQCDQGLTVTGEADGATQAALLALHES